MMNPHRIALDRDRGLGHAGGARRGQQLCRRADAHALRLEPGGERPLHAPGLPVARLLAELALDATGETEWAERGTWRRLKVADLACGSGTLLNAYLEAVNDRIRKAGGGERGAAEFHKYAVERLVTGLDINPVSLQMAAGRMTLANPSVDYRKMALRAMPYGSVEGETVRLGTLELLTDEDVVGTAATANDGGKQQPAFFDSAAVDPEVVQDVEDRRLVMMNPPFTANDKKGRKFTPEVTKALQRRERQIRDRLTASDEKAAGVIDANSIRTMFTVHAARREGPRRGSRGAGDDHARDRLHRGIGTPRAAVPRIAVPHRFPYEEPRESTL